MNIKLIEDNYGITIKKIKMIKTNAYCIETNDDRKYFIKKSRVEKEKVDKIIKLFNYLETTDFSCHLIKFLKTKTDGYYFIANKDIFLLSYWVDSITFDYSHENDIVNAILILNKLHRTTENTNILKGEYYPQYETVFRKKLSQIIWFLNIIQQKGKNTFFDKLFKKSVNEFYNRFEKCIILTKNIYELFIKHNNRVIIHHDTAHHNFLKSKTQLYLIDFDYTLYDYEIHDYVNLLVRILRTNEWNLSYLKLFLKVLDHFNIKKKLWIEMIIILMLFPQEIWQVGLQYYDEKQPWDEEYFIKRLKSAIEIQKRKEEVIKRFWGDIFVY